MWSSSRKQRRALGAFDLTTVKEAALKRIPIGPVQVPVAVLAAAGAYGALILYRMIAARNTEADGTNEEFERPGTGPCTKIEDQYRPPAGCGTTGVTGYYKGVAKEIQLKELPGYPGKYLQTAPVDTYTPFLRMRTAALADGHQIQLNSAFRTMAHQRDLYKTYRNKGKPKASAPGYSPHQMGRAVDIQTAGGTLPIYFWLIKNSQRFGFFKTEPTESWHFQYKPEFDPFLKK